MSEKLVLDDIANKFGQRAPDPIFKIRYYGIMALLTERNGELSFVLNKRAANIRQGGDICFPGGRKEDNENLLETALRETEEELGIPKEHIQILGKSDYLLAMHQRYLQPFIGFVPYEILHTSMPNCGEVAQIFTIPVSHLLQTNPEKYHIHWETVEQNDFPYQRIEGGSNYDFGTYRSPCYFYEYKGHTIWGLTAQIIKNIVDILKSPKS